MQSHKGLYNMSSDTLAHGKKAQGNASEVNKPFTIKPSLF